MKKQKQTRKEEKYKNDLDVVNEALELVGHEKIQGLDTVAGSYRNVILREFHATRMRLLSKKNWEFAIREEDLIKKPKKNVFQPTYPPIKLLDKSKNVQIIKHGYDPKTNKNLFVVADEKCPNKIRVRYIEDVEGVENMSPEKFVAELANRFRSILKTERKKSDSK